MSSFVGLPDENVDDLNVVNGAFYPDISVGYIQEFYRIPSEFESGMVRNQLQLSMAWANEQLTEWKAAQVAAGHETLKAIPCEVIGGDTTKELHYKQAVCCHAKAMLLPRYESMVRAKSASRSEDIEDLKSSVDQNLQLSRVALSALQGKSTIMVDLL